MLIDYERDVDLMLDRSLRILVKLTPECGRCKLRDANNVCFFASMCLLDDEENFKCFIEKRVDK